MNRRTALKNLTMSFRNYDICVCIISFLLMIQGLIANTITVTSTLDAGAGTLRAAVTASGRLARRRYQT